MTHWACRLPGPVTATSPRLSGPWSFTYCEHSLWIVGPATAARSAPILLFRTSRASSEELTSASTYAVKVTCTLTCAMHVQTGGISCYTLVYVFCVCFLVYTTAERAWFPNLSIAKWSNICLIDSWGKWYRFWKHFQAKSSFVVHSPYYIYSI